MARVAVLTFSEIAKDVRVMRHVHALRDLCEVVSCGVGPTPEGVVRHLRIPDGAVQLPKKPGVIMNLAVRRYRAAYAGSDAAREALALLSDASFDAIVANDVLTLPCAIQAAAGRPVIADLHEFAPGQVGKSMRFSLMVGPLMDFVCGEYLPQAAAVTTVCDSIAEEYARTYGVEVQTITNASPFRAPVPRPVGAPIRLVHSGRAIPNRQLELMIRAAAGVPGVTLDLYLLSSPWTDKYLRFLHEMASRTSNVVVRDALPRDELFRALDSFDIGVFVLPPTSFNARHALPNKYFDFVQSGLGILIGPSPEMAALTRQYEMGRVLPDFSESTLRASLESLVATEVEGWKSAACAAAPELSSEHQATLLRQTVERVLAV